MSEFKIGEQVIIINPLSKFYLEVGVIESELHRSDLYTDAYGMVS